jgi:hypothetical protein
MRFGLLMLASLVASACAGGQSGLRDPGVPTVELVVRNELAVSITAYVEWSQRRPLRLQEISPGATATFEEPIRGAEVRVVASRVGRGGGDDLAPAFAAVRNGDRLEWRFTRTGPRPYLRLPPRE